MSTPNAAGIQAGELSAAKRALLEARLRGRHQPSTLVRRAHGGQAPLSFAQERLYFIDRLLPGGTSYNVHLELRLPRGTDEAALERALGEIVRRHETLRTVFREVDGAPVQVIAPFAGFTLPVEDLAGLEETERREEVRRLAAREAAHRFDLGRGPLFRARLLRLGAEVHGLLLCMHHIVSDGWSMRVLARELPALYEAYLRGGPSPLPEPAVQYADYAAWQREQLQGETLRRQLAYWKERLAGAPELLELPADHPRPPSPSFRGGMVPVEVPRGLLERLRELARAEGATLYMTLLAAFQVLLARYGGSEDVVVGCPVAGRGHKEVQELIGFFVNTLVLRTDLSGDPSFRETLRRVRETVLGAFEHQELPFERLVAELQPERSLSHAPLFQVMFSLDDTGEAGGGVEGLGVAGVDAALETAKFDLTLDLAAAADGVRGGLTYATDLFERATAERMVEHLARVLEWVARNPDARLSGMELAGEAERRRVVEEWNRTEAEPPPRRCVHQLFEEQAGRTPDAVAVAYGGESLTYGALNEQANRLAHHLVRLGVRPEGRVALCQEPGLRMVVSMLGVLKAGGAYVPLDPGHPAERIRTVLADSGAAVLLTQDALRGALPAHEGVEVVSVDGDRMRIAAGSAENPECRTGPDSLAYVIYTSGSTGTPKGVGIEHRGIVRLVRGTDYVRLAPGDRVAQASSAAFDAATFEVWGALLNGALLVGIPREVALSPADLAATLAARSVTVLFLTTALFNQIARDRPGALRPLRCVLFGGEAVDPAAVKRVLEAGAPERLLHVYGPTENTTFSSWHRVAEVPDGARTIPIGRRIAHTTLLVLHAGVPVPVGVPGELHVGGEGVARGYPGRPEATAERFVPDPFGGTPGARMYRTGDRARWRADGTLEFLGRLDAQVKIRGFRIEPGEVEAALRRHPGVSGCLVVAREDAASGVPGERRLVAYVVGPAGAGELREHLRGSLPEYMVPAAFVALGALPLTPSGKTDRGALPAPEYAAPQARYVAPRTPAEEVLAGVWAEVLGVERVGTADSFFELGGHSLLATRVVARLRELSGVELPLRALFEEPTVAGLARRVEELRRAEAPPLPPVVPAERAGALPLSFAQERLWFLDRLQPGSTAYHMPYPLRLRGALDPAALERALGEVVRRHEALRTTFPEVEGAPVQAVAPFAGFALPVVDLSALGAAERAGAAGRHAAAEAARPFDLSAGPLFRAALLRLAGEEHVLLLGMHHIVSDGWSLGVLRRELSALYAAYRAGGASPLPELAVQYADHAVWQRRHLQGEALGRQLAYWRERLAGAPELLELPTDRPRPGVPSHQGDTVPVEVPGGLTDRLRALGRGEGATLYMVLLGAFQVLLAKYAGSEDVVVGSPVAGRTRREVEGVIGFFANTLVLRTELGGDPGFREVVRRVREVTLGAYEHQEVPFERLVAELQPERSLGRSPLFQVMFTLQDAEGPEEGLPGLSVERVGAGSGAAAFDLTLTLAATPHGLRGSLEYGADLFEHGTAGRMAGHLGRVLEQVAGDADARLSGLELLGAGERRRVLEEWNRTAAEHPADRCVHQLFEEQAARTPGAVAVASGEEALTYRELNERASRLSRYLRRRGVGPEARVGLCLERGTEMVVAMLGVLKAGGAYVPLAPDHPAERLGFMLADAGVAVLLTRDALRDALPAHAGVEVVSLDAARGEVAAERPGNLEESGAEPEGLAYVVYTSGSTGRPKGVMVPHRALANFLLSMREEPGMRADDVLLAVTTLSFDIAALELLLPLVAGARTVIAGREAAADPAALARLLEVAGATVMQATPATWRMLLASGWRGNPRLRMLCGGESLPPQLAEQLRARGAGLWNLYGPTETTVWSTLHRVEDPGAGSTVPIGRPIANTRVRVLDAHLRPLPVGVPGDLYVAGEGVARGYLGRPGLTAEKFLPDPFPAAGGGRVYRTGDRARWRADGTLEFLGRQDAQVKVRGFRVEPGEVEAALERHPGVREAVVVAREDAPGDTRLVAYVVGPAGAGELREHLRGSLPEYMVPAAFVALGALPLTPSGKTDRGALPAPEYAAPQARYVAPRTPAEEVLAGVWAEVLGVERVGTADSFFELGGHSLLATRVVARLRELSGVELPLRALFEEPTVAGLARRVEELRRAEAPPLPPVVPAERAGALPLSFAQERLWFLDRLQPGSTAYHMPYPLRLRGALDPAALERALGEVVRRHEALRTTFPEVEGAPVQAVAPFAGFALPVVDLSALGAAERAGAAGRHAAAEAARPFDLSAGPLFRAALLRLAGEEHVLLLGMHHIVSDGWSLGVLRRELSALYAAYRAGGASPLPELAVQYADHAVWQRRHLRGEALGRQLAYWRERLAGAPELLELPTDRPRPGVPSHRGDTVPVEVPGGLTDRLRALGRGEGATLYMVLLGAFQVLLAKYAGSEDVVVGSPVAGRTRREVEGVIGFFANTLVLRTELGGDPGFREVVRRVREVTLGAYEHQEVPFERLVAELQPERSLGRSPLFQVMFTLQDAEGPEEGLPGLSVERVSAELRAAKFDVNLALDATPHGLLGELEYGAELFERGTIERMAGHLARVLEQVAGDADVRLSGLDLVTTAEREQVLRAWNDTAAEYDVDGGLRGLFRAQAARTPDVVALVCGDERLTYAELLRRATVLAGRLASLGVGVDSRVGLCLERSTELVVGVLAVVEAGGAYVPIDPEYPEERVAYMLEDAGTVVLLTQQRVAARLPASGVAVLCLDGPVTEPAAAPAEAASAPRATLPGSSPDSLAYVIYTSGSTGRPKGVAMHQRPLLNLLAWQARAWERTGAATTLQFATISFDVSFHEIFSCLLGGGTLVMAPEQVRRDPAALLELLEREGVERLFLPLVALQHVAEEAVARKLVPSRLREVQTAGEQLRVTSAIRRWLGMLGAPLHNHYGPSETHVATALALRGDPAGWPVLPSIGAPIANTRCYVLDAGLRPVPPGVPGELYLAGDCVARGYLGRAELTAERFVPDPFPGAAGARMYRSGDRARWRAGGEIEFLGRTDQQVKVRGFRIEPGEVEAALERHPGVREALVYVREDAPGGRRLVGYVVPGPGREAPTAVELRGFLAGGLPGYMVPSAFVALDSLPLTPSGKIDRRALPAPGRGEAAAGRRPRTPAEEVLCGIWAEVLQRDGAGVDDNFFDLGGHSLLATQVASRVRQVFGVELPVRALFEAPTAAGLAERVDALLRERPEAPVPPLLPAPRDGSPLPLSFAQQRLWFLDRLQPGSSAYNLASPLRLRGRLDVAALRRALSALARRHEALRTVFAEVDGEPVQRVRAARPVPVPVVDLRALPGEARESEARRLLAEEEARPFDLEAGPLLRVGLVALEETEWVLTFTLHHAVGDGWSMGVLVREASTLYEACARGAELGLPELQVQYADYALWQRERLRGAVLEAELAWWRERLAGAPALLELPTDRPRPQVQDARGGSVPFAVRAEAARGLRALSRREGATLFMTLLTGWQLLLARYADVEDVSVGAPVAGRNRLEVEGLIGFFVNTLVLRTGLSGNPTFGGLLGRVREGVLGAYQHQDVPFERLVEELAPERSRSHTPLFQVMFALQNHRVGSLRLGELEAAAVRGDGEQAVKFDLSLEMAEAGEELRGTLSYRAELWDRESAERMLAHFGALLDGVAEAPGRRAWEVEVLRGAEREQVLTEWGAPAFSAPAGSPVHERIAARAARTPDAVAVVHGTDTLTRGELHRRASRLAGVLRGLGVGPEVRVAIFLERTPELVVALLATLQAGGAYLPLDPEYPAERLALMLADARPAVLLTTERLAATLPESGAVVVRLDRGVEAWSVGEPAPPVQVSPDNLAYLIYTSGSTGTPKAVAVPHRALSNHMRWMERAFPLDAADRVLQKTPLSFDASVWEFFAPLLEGAVLVLAAPGAHRDPAVLAGEVAEGGITVLQVVPTLAEALLERGVPEGRARLRRLFCGGEALAPGLAERARAATGAEVVNLYGPTEGCIDATAHVYAGAPGGTVPIGRPVDGTSARVVDRGGVPVPVAVPGELLLGGAQLARGYLGRPELTAEHFVPDPFTREPGARLYRTGDRVRWRSDGTLEFLGRVDDQVKLRGFRVEPGEVEAVLARHPSVRQAAVAVRESAATGPRLVAYLVPAAREAAPAELRGYLRERLPAHMVPSAFVALDALPLTPGGKLDRRALPVPEAARGGDPPVAPRDALELRLARTWEEVLGAGPVGVRDDFFALGGHSLLALRLLAAVERLTGRRVPLATLLAGPTVEQLARVVRHGGSLPAPGPLVPIRPAGNARPLFFVHAAGGNVASYAALARYLGDDQPFYALQARGVDAEESPHLRVEDMAADYLAQLRKVQERGPYRLGGWSMGGLVAFEMARMLEAAGEEVELLALLDSRVPDGASSPLDPDDAGLLAGFMLHLGLAGEQLVLAAPEAAALPPGERLCRAWEAARTAGLVPDDLELARFERSWAVFRANVAAAAAYRPGPIASDVLLVLAGDRPTPAAAEGARWAALTSGSVRSAAVAGDHFTLVREPHVRGVADLLADALGLAGAAEAGSTAGGRAERHI